MNIFNDKAAEESHASTGTKRLASKNSSDGSASADRLGQRSASLNREADLHDLAAERFLVLGEIVRAERERAAANRFRDEAANRRT